MLLQRVYSLYFDRDESLSADLHTEWDRYYAQLSLLNNDKFPRKTLIESATEIELHGFCDVSETAYGACVYLRTINLDGHIWTRLHIAKWEVAALKSQSIPPLELSGALLHTSFIATLHQALPDKIYCTDSTIVLYWINTFVANRVAEIQTKTHNTD